MKTRTKKSITLTSLTSHLDRYLKIRYIPDRSLNGLQVQGAQRIHRAAFAVDATLGSIRASARIGAQVLIVHHGLFWGAGERITGVMRRRIGALLENDISLYAAHLPLDLHEEVGNNAEIARLLGLELEGKFADYHGVEIGYIARSQRALTRSLLGRMIASALQCRVTRLDAGPPRISRVGIVSGGAAQFAAEARERGCEAFVTGETSHEAFHPALEAGINVFFAGHYSSETAGVKALARRLQDLFGIECFFISTDTGY